MMTDNLHFLKPSAMADALNNETFGDLVPGNKFVFPFTRLSNVFLIPQTTGNSKEIEEIEARQAFLVLTHLSQKLVES